MNNNNYDDIKNVYVHSLMTLFYMEENEAILIFKSYYNNGDLMELKNIINNREREVTNDE